MSIYIIDDVVVIRFPMRSLNAAIGQQVFSSDQYMLLIEGGDNRSFEYSYEARREVRAREWHIMASGSTAWLRDVVTLIGSDIDAGLTRLASNRSAASSTFLRKAQKAIALCLLPQSVVRAGMRMKLVQGFEPGCIVGENVSLFEKVSGVVDTLDGVEFETIESGDKTYKRISLEPLLNPVHAALYFMSYPIRSPFCPSAGASISYRSYSLGRGRRPSLCEVACAA